MGYMVRVQRQPELGYFGATTATLQQKLESLSAKIKAFIPRLQKELNDGAMFYNSTKKMNPANGELAQKLWKLSKEVSEANFAPPVNEFFLVGDGKSILQWPILLEWHNLNNQKVTLTKEISGEVKSSSTTADKIKKYAVPAALAATAGAGLWLLFRGGGGLGGLGLMKNPTSQAPSLPKYATTRQVANFKKKSRKWFGNVVREQMKSGKPQPQAVAIAYSYARRMMCPRELRIMGWRS